MKESIIEQIASLKSGASEIKQSIVDILTEAFDVPVIQQGSLSDDDTYPDDFFAFWNSNSSSSDFYDNTKNAIIWEFELNFYSNNPEHTNACLLIAAQVMEAHGWIIDGEGYDVVSDEETHTGRGFTMVLIEPRENETGGNNNE